MADLLALDIARRNFDWDELWSKKLTLCPVAPPRLAAAIWSLRLKRKMHYFEKRLLGFAGVQKWVFRPATRRLALEYIER